MAPKPPWENKLYMSFVFLVSELSWDLTSESGFKWGKKGKHSRKEALGTEGAIDWIFYAEN